eukprot:m.124139 g.124139  ORF g.124139 m.124139 type:complete len:61 (-) comp13489_c0_seq2:33-215(-)
MTCCADPVASMPTNDKAKINMVSEWHCSNQLHRLLRNSVRLRCSAGDAPDSRLASAEVSC